MVQKLDMAQLNAKCMYFDSIFSSKVLGMAQQQDDLWWYTKVCAGL